VGSIAVEEVVEMARERGQSLERRMKRSLSREARGNAR